MKSHLSFSPKRITISADALRNEKLFSHIPKQMVSVSSEVPAATTAPAKLVINSRFQPKNFTNKGPIKKDLTINSKFQPKNFTNKGPIKKDLTINSKFQPENLPNMETIKEDLTTELRKVITTLNETTPITFNVHDTSALYNESKGKIMTTIKVAPGIGCLSFSPITVDIGTPKKEYPKPSYTFTCLIALALKNSPSGTLPVSEIYKFVCKHFPYFRTAQTSWKNQIRYYLCSTAAFYKIENSPINGPRKACLWAMKPERMPKIDGNIRKYSLTDPIGIRRAMAQPKHLDALERGEMKHDSSGDSDTESDSQSDSEETSDLEDQEKNDTIVNIKVIKRKCQEETRSKGLDLYCSEVLSERDDVGDIDDKDIAREEIVNRSKTSQTYYEQDFNNVIEDIFDAIDDDKETVRKQILQEQQPELDLIELSEAELNAWKQFREDAIDSGCQASKRARLDLNWTALEKKVQRLKDLGFRILVEPNKHPYMFE